MHTASVHARVFVYRRSSKRQLLKDKGCALLSCIAQKSHETKKSGPVATSAGNLCDLHGLVVPIVLGE